MVKSRQGYRERLPNSRRYKTFFGAVASDKIGRFAVQIHSLAKNILYTDSVNCGKDENKEKMVHFIKSRTVIVPGLPLQNKIIFIFTFLQIIVLKNLSTA